MLGPVWEGVEGPASTWAVELYTDEDVDAEDPARSRELRLAAEDEEVSRLEEGPAEDTEVSIRSPAAAMSVGKVYAIRCRVVKWCRPNEADHAVGPSEGRYSQRSKEG